MRTAIDSYKFDVRKQEQTGIFLPSSGLEGQREREYILMGTHLRDVLLQSSQPSESPHAHRALQDAEDPNYVERDVLEHDYHPDHLSLPTGGFQEQPPSLGDNHGAFHDDMLISSWANRYSHPNPVVIEGDPQFEELSRMNETQKRAMAMMIGERISLVQGVGLLNLITTLFLSAFFC